MCGLTGHFGISINGRLDRGMKSSLEDLYHRGPDGKDTFYNEHEKVSIALGHTRLSIIDLTFSENQPIMSKDKRFVMVFNGEIYNYNDLKEELKANGTFFDSLSDSEVLVEAWAKWHQDCLKKIQGMYAFVIIDLLKNEIFLVRDHCGIKPLYYAIQEGTIFFSSEPKALSRLLNRKVNLDDVQIINYLTLGIDSFGDETYFQGIKQVLPGHYVKANIVSGNLICNTNQFWTIQIQDEFEMSKEEISEHLYELLRGVTRAHMQSDVPLGMTLSGGVDSSILALLAKSLSANGELNTFSFISNDMSVSEKHWVDLINQKSNSNSHFARINQSELIDNLIDFIDCQGEPVRTPSGLAQYMVYKTASQKGFKVLLDGQGADEVFGGYLGYPGSVLKEDLAKRNFVTATRFSLNWLRRFPDHRNTLIREIALDSLPHFALKKLAHKGFPERINLINLEDRNSIAFDRLFDLQKSQNAKNKRYLSSRLAHAVNSPELHSLLRIVDRNSMRWSVESRVPYLDKSIIEFANRIPHHLQVSIEAETKFLLKETFRDLLPQEIRYRKKFGYSIGKNEWLPTVKQELIRRKDSLTNFNFLDLENVQQLFRNIESDKPLDSVIIWRLFNLVIWKESL